MTNVDVGVKIPKVVISQNHHLDLRLFRAWKMLPYSPSEDFDFNFSQRILGKHDALGIQAPSKNVNGMEPKYYAENMSGFLGMDD